MLEYNQQEVSLRIGRARGYEAEKHNERKRGMMKKIVSALAALAVAGGMCMPAFAAEKVTAAGVPADGYKFVDIAYDGDGTFVALAKDEASGNSQRGWICYSDDNGNTWQQTVNIPNAIKTNCYLFANPNSRQQLVWWDAKNMFVVHNSSANGAYTTYENEKGLNWQGASNLYWLANAMTTVSGDALIMSSNDSVSVTDTADSNVLSNNAMTGVGVNTALTVSASNVDENGNRNVFVTGNSSCASIVLTKNEDGTYSWDNLTKGYQARLSGSGFENLPTNSYDSVYTGKSNQFVFINDSNAFYVAKDPNGENKFSQFVYKYSSPSSANVTGVNVNDSYIVLGMSDGTMYYTDNAAIDENTEWKQVPGMNADEPVKNIEFISDSEFVALSETGIYKGSLVADEPEPVEPVTVTPLDNDFEDGSQGWTAAIPASTEAVTGGTWKITNSNNQVATVDANIGAAMEGSFTIGLVLTETAVGDNTISSVAFELK